MICLEGDYSNEQLEELRRLIRHNGHTIDVSRHRLLVNLRKAGFGFPRRSSAYERYWHEFANNPRRLRAALPSRYRDISEARTTKALIDRLRRFILGHPGLEKGGAEYRLEGTTPSELRRSDRLMPDPQIMHELKRHCEGRRLRSAYHPPLSADHQTALADLGLPYHPNLVRKAARHLRAYHSSKSRSGPKRDEVLDTAVIQCSSLYARLAGVSDPTSLGANPEAPFVVFACKALAPFFGEERLSAEAIAARWKNAKNIDISTSRFGRSRQTAKT